VIDCAGTCGGDSVVDDCGVCDGGNASMDDCGVCDGDNSDQDCAGVCGGDAFTDCEGQCVSSYYLSWQGDGSCDDGNYGLYLGCEEFNFDDGDCDDACGVFNGDDTSCADECGVPNGDNSSCAGCDGVANSGLEFDYCDVCGGDNIANECEDPCIAAGGLIVSMSDAYGDGWDSGVLIIGDESFTLDGASGEACYMGGMDVAVTCGGSSWNYELSWSISDGSSELLHRYLSNHQIEHHLKEAQNYHLI
jgi:hypothetical protein